MNIANILTLTARKHGDRPAVSCGKQPYQSYRSLTGRSLSLASGVVDKLGLRRGDNAAIILKNSPQYIEILFGLWSAGICVVPINAKLHPNEFSFILDHSGCRLCFCSPEFVDILTPMIPGIENLDAVISTGESAYESLFQAPSKNSPEDLDPSELAWLFYTSGTTGRPKGAMLTHHNLAVMSHAHLQDIDRIAETDCIIHAAPLSHGSGMYVLPHVVRGANNIIPESGGFDSGETLELLDCYEGCSFFFAPTMVHRLIRDPGIGSVNLNHLKNIVYGGGPMYLEDLKQALSILGPRLAQIYGQGEAPMTITGMNPKIHAAAYADGNWSQLASAGLPRTGVEVKVFNEDDRELGPGEVGEVVCRGEIVMAGYWRNLEATAETLKNGWLHTGDLGCLDESGFLTLKDRSKDMIISGGTNIYPREIEDILLQHEQVKEASVIGSPHPDWGEEVVAFIVSVDGAEIDRCVLEELCITNIARFKRPKKYHFLASLPKNNTGKVLKTELRKMVSDQDF